MVLSGGVLFLYSARARFSFVLPILAALAVSGLPFTPTASGWSGLLGEVFTFFDLTIILVVALLIVGLLRHATRAGDPLKDMQGWIRVAYPLGLLLLSGSGWLIVLVGREDTFTVGRWPASATAVLMSLIVSAIVLRRNRLFELEQRIGWLDAILRATGRWLAWFFGLRWLYGLLQDFMGLLRRAVESFSLILEGEGGVLWALVLLALLLTLLVPGMGR